MWGCAVWKEHNITISQYHYTSWWISLSSGVHVPPADCQRKINQVELLWKPSPRPLKPNVTGSCAKPLNLKTGINTESSNVFRWNSSKCVNNDVFVSLFGLWLLASELQNGQCPGAWQSLLPLPRSSHTSHETSNFKWKRMVESRHQKKLDASNCRDFETSEVPNALASSSALATVLWLI